MDHISCQALNSELFPASKSRGLAGKKASLYPPPPRIEDVEISEKQAFLSKFSQAKSKFESKSSPKINEKEN